MAYILGTAGHIDHGKTSLIRALTTIDCDRLKEEKKRGITIDLGFAWLDLPNGDRLGIIDVPGHEKFVRTMVAGACGIDFVLLVIAADEGIMPQTREHLEICQLLGIKHGVVALTKIDLVDAEWCAMVRAEIAQNLEGTFLQGAPIIPVSATTGEGLTTLREHILALIQSHTQSRQNDLVRMPIDRVFTIHGHGTVVTGTLLSGTLTVGDSLVVMPKGLETKVRFLERHGTPVTTIEAGSRCAINVQGLETTDIARGDTIARPKTLVPSTRFYTKTTLLQHAPTLKQRTELHFHLGTKECLAKLRFRDRLRMEPGEQAFVEVIFDQPLCAVFGDRAVLRTGSPLRTIAGCEILCPIPPLWPKHHPDKDQYIATWLSLPTLSEKNPSDCLAVLLDLFGVPGLSESELALASGQETKTRTKALKTLMEKGVIVCWDTETKSYIHKNHLAKLVCDILAYAQTIHDKAPLSPHFAKEALLAATDSLPKKLFACAIETCIRTKRLVADGDGVRLASHSVTLDTKDQNTSQQLLKALQKTPLTPPNIKEVLENVRLSDKEALPLLNHLTQTGDIIRINPTLYYAKEGYDDIMERIYTWFKDHESLDITDLKGLLGLSRKYLIALLEYMDNTHITVRVGNKRTLRQTR